jgi:hypothetical protein
MKLPCSLCGGPTRLDEGRTPLPVRHVECQAAFIAPIEEARVRARIEELRKKNR